MDNARKAVLKLAETDKHEPNVEFWLAELALDNVQDAIRNSQPLADWEEFKADL